jgi:hypothetical protein
MSSAHPYIEELYAIYQSEVQSPFRKVHRMIDLFETLVKSHTIVILSEYFKRNALSDTAKGMLAAGLRTPSLGTWQLFSREIFKELQANNQIFLIENFDKEFKALDKALNQSKTNIIALRNAYAHGATPSDEDCLKDIKDYEPFLDILMANTWFKNSSTSIVENKAVLVSSKSHETLSLHPLLIVKDEKGTKTFAFFNDLKDDKVGLLSYPLSKHYREKEFLHEFLSYLPLKEWKNSGNNEFNQRINELTETFKGRRLERETIRQFILTKNKGFLSIQGNPGIGKSALIAQVHIDLSNEKNEAQTHLIPYFIRRGTAQSDALFLINYLNKSTDLYFSDGKHIKSESNSIWELQQQLFNKWRAFAESPGSNKLVFLIDGLDEGLENNILEYLPRETFDKILIIYGSRPAGQKTLENFWSELPIEQHEKILLNGLGKNDIRALLYEVSNKYLIEKDSAWIDAIEKRSEGNPLYLKLLCNAIENGSITMNDPTALPKEIDQYYKAIIDRYAENLNDGDALLNSLYIFAAALDYLTLEHILAIGGLGEAQTERVLNTLKEVLYENPISENVLDYQLFHESFREYLLKTKASAIKKAEEKILNFCRQWQNYTSFFEQKYALEYYSSHLIKHNFHENFEEILALSKDRDFEEAQIKVLKNFEASKLLQKQSLKAAAQNQKPETAIENALELARINMNEQYTVQDILAMLQDNDIENLLIRIQSLGGNNPTYKTRQFLVYMLCLKELTLGTCKDKIHNRAALEILLKHFDETVSLDSNESNWRLFYPFNLMLKIAVVLDEYGIDYLPLFKRMSDESKSINKYENHVSDSGPYNASEIKIILSLDQSDDFNPSNNLISLIEQKRYKDIQEILDIFIEFTYSTGPCIDIINLCLKSPDESMSIIDYFQSELRKQCISKKSPKPLVELAFILRVHGLHSETDKLIEDVYDLIKGFENEIDKADTLFELANFLKEGDEHQINEIKTKVIHLCENIIKSENVEIGFLSIISRLFKYNFVQLNSELANKLLNLAEKLYDETPYGSNFTKSAEYFIELELEEQVFSKLEKALSTKSYRHGFFLDSLLYGLAQNGKGAEIHRICEIATEKQIAIRNFENIIDEAKDLNVLKLYIDMHDRIMVKDSNLVHERISIKLLSFKELDMALEYSKKITKFSNKANVYLAILDFYIIQSDIDAFKKLLYEILNELKSVTVRNSYSLVKKLANLCIKTKQTDELINGIRKQYGILFLGKIECALASELICKGKAIEAHQIYLEILESNPHKNENKFWIFGHLLDLIKNHSQIKDKHYLDNILNKALALSIKNIEHYKSNNKSEIEKLIIEYCRLGRYIEAIEIIRNISNDNIKFKCYISVVNSYLGKGKQGETKLLLEEINLSLLSSDNNYTKVKRQVSLAGFLIKNKNIAEGNALLNTLLIESESMENNDERFDVLSRIYLRLNQYEKAIECSNAIESKSNKTPIWIRIMANLARNSKVEELKNFVATIITLTDYRNRDKLLKAGAIEFSTIDLIKDALNLCNEISDYLIKTECLLEITRINLAKDNKEIASKTLNAAIENAGKIEDERSIKSNTFLDIAGELILQGRTEEAIKIAESIGVRRIRANCFFDIGSMFRKTNSLKKGLELMASISKEEDALYFNYGICRNLEAKDSSAENILDLLVLAAEDQYALMYLLHYHAAYSVFCSDTPKDKIHKLNQTLNINWMLELTKNLDKERKTKTSMNVGDWINEIEDEDDREEILLNVRKVSKGKITEEDFSMLLREILH